MYKNRVRLSRISEARCEMIQLRHNGRVVLVGDTRVLDDFKRKVYIPITETIGLDECGNIWSVRTLPDVTEYQPTLL